MLLSERFSALNSVIIYVHLQRTADEVSIHSGASPLLPMLTGKRSVGSTAEGPGISERQLSRWKTRERTTGSARSVHERPPSDRMRDNCIRLAHVADRGRLRMFAVTDVVDQGWVSTRATSVP